MDEKRTIYHRIDDTLESLLLKISDHYPSYQDFESHLYPYCFERTLALEGIVPQVEVYQHFYSRLELLWKRYSSSRYHLTLDRSLLEEINQQLTGEKGVREKNIVHRNVLHQITDYQDISNALDEVFLQFHTKDVIPILERYAQLLHGLMTIFPFFNGISLRFFCNLFLVQHEYLPVVITEHAKQKFFYYFQYPFKRFKNSFFPLVEESLEQIRLTFLSSIK